MATAGHVRRTGEYYVIYTASTLVADNGFVNTLLAILIEQYHYSVFACVDRLVSYVSLVVY